MTNPYVMRRWRRLAWVLTRYGVALYAINLETGLYDRWLAIVFPRRLGHLKLNPVTICRPLLLLRSLYA